MSEHHTDDPSPAPRGRYRRAAATLLRDTTLDTMRDLLADHSWRSLTMTDVAKAAGLSRQSLYNEFGSRQGLAEAYAIRLADSFVALVDLAFTEHVDDAHAALAAAFAAFFEAGRSDPLVRSVQRGDAPDDLLRLLTTDNAVLVASASERLSDVLCHGWVRARIADARIAATATVRLALSFVPTPPTDLAEEAEGLARLLTPFVDSITRPH